MEYLLFAVLLYFILMTARNLVHLLRRPGAGSTGASGPGGASAAGPQERAGGTSGNRRQKSEADPRFWGEDIEDATWEDLPD
ncbi:MAG: hypothetical protein R6T83_06285 [Salinibacter sp.]